MVGGFEEKLDTLVNEATETTPKAEVIATLRRAADELETAADDDDDEDKKKDERPKPQTR